MQSRFVTVKQLAELYPFTESAIRQLIHAERLNGLFEAKAVYRIGRKVMVSPEAFGAWIESKQTPRPISVGDMSVVLGSAT